MFQVGRGDMACDGDWLVMGCQTGVAWSKVGQELMQLNTEEVVQVGLIPLHSLTSCTVFLRCCKRQFSISRWV